MPARLSPLRDDHVGAGLLRLDAVMHLAAHDDDLHPVVMHHFYEFLRHRKSGDEDLDLLLDHHGHVRAHHVGDRRQQIDGERLVGQLAGLADFGAQIVGAQRRGADHAESARVGNRGDQLVHRDAAHSGEQDRIFDSKVIANRRVQHREFSTSEPSVRLAPEDFFNQAMRGKQAPNQAAMYSQQPIRQTKRFVRNVKLSFTAESIYR